MFSHVSQLSTSQRMKNVSRSECHRVHATATGDITLSVKICREIEPNSTTPSSFIAVGHRDMRNGHCENRAVFQDYDGPHQHAVASYLGCPTLTDYTGVFDESTGG